MHEDGSPRRREGREGPWSRLSTLEWRRIFEGVAEGRVAELERVYELAAERLYGLALWHTRSPEDARDVVQEVFVRLAEQKHRLRRIRKPHAWLLTVAYRLAVDIVRKRKRRSAQPIDETLLLTAPSEDPVRAIDAKRLSRLVAELPPDQRDAIYLRHFAQCSYAEIGRIVGAPTFTAASRCRLGIDRLRRCIGGSHD
jgi:RNA polymerase sigma-70 factor (ECF subfamily)